MLPKRCPPSIVHQPMREKAIQWTSWRLSRGKLEASEKLQKWSTCFTCINRPGQSARQPQLAVSPCFIKRVTRATHCKAPKPGTRDDTRASYFLCIKCFARPHWSVMPSFYGDRSVLPDVRLSVNWFEVREIENVNVGFAEFSGLV